MEDTTSFFNLLMNCTRDEALGFRKQIHSGEKDQNQEFSSLLHSHKESHLASGDTYPCLTDNFRVAENTIACLIPEVCQSIREEFRDGVIKCQTTSDVINGHAFFQHQNFQLQNFQGLVHQSLLQIFHHYYHRVYTPLSIFRKQLFFIQNYLV